MKEYIVHVPKHLETNQEEIVSFFGEQIIELIRCKDCKHRPHKTKDGYTRSPRVQVGVYAWGEPEYDDDLTCPYVCEDTWYSCVPDDEQYCDRAEPKEEKR